MKAFLASVIVAIVILIGGYIIMKSEYGMSSKDVYQSQHGSVNL